MKKITNKNIFAIAATITLVAAEIFVSASKTLAEIPGKYLAADLEGSDLLSIATEHPIISWTVLVILVVLGIGYGIRHITRKKEVNS